MTLDEDIVELIYDRIFVDVGNYCFVIGEFQRFEYRALYSDIVKRIDLTVAVNVAAG